MNRLIGTTWSGIRRLVKGRRRDHQFDYPEAHRQEPDRFARVVRITQQPPTVAGSTIGMLSAFGK